VEGEHRHYKQPVQRTRKVREFTSSLNIAWVGDIGHCTCCKCTYFASHLDHQNRIQNSLLTQFRELESNLEAYLIKELLSSSRCFMECNEVTDIERFCPKKLPGNKERKLVEELEHRFCPDDKTVCKAECMTKQQYWNKKLPIISYKKLEAYDSSLLDLMKKSWLHYNLHGNQSYEPQVLVKEGKIVPGMYGL